MQGLSCPASCGIFLDQGLNVGLLPWQANSLPRSHCGSPVLFFFFFFKTHTSKPFTLVEKVLGTQADCVQLSDCWQNQMLISLPRPGSVGSVEIEGAGVKGTRNRCCGWSPGSLPESSELRVRGDGSLVGGKPLLARQRD